MYLHNCRLFSLKARESTTGRAQIIQQQDRSYGFSERSQSQLQIIRRQRTENAARSQNQDIIIDFGILLQEYESNIFTVKITAYVQSINGEKKFLRSSQDKAEKFCDGWNLKDFFKAENIFKESAVYLKDNVLTLKFKGYLPQLIYFFVSCIFILKYYRLK